MSDFNAETARFKQTLSSQILDSYSTCFLDVTMAKTTASSFRHVPNRRLFPPDWTCECLSMRAMSEPSDFSTTRILHVGAHLTGMTVALKSRLSVSDLPLDDGDTKSGQASNNHGMDLLKLK